MAKYIFITGGVMSGLGKGVTAASIGKLLQFRGFKVDMIKIDPYLNVDAGTMNPIEHGEVFVTEKVWSFFPSEKFTYNICETDQDFGTYERFLDINLHPMNNITSGQIYLEVILKERLGEYLGKTVQIIPHVIEKIKERIKKAVENTNPDVLIVEVGGTVGDIEAMPFLEAIRQFILEHPSDSLVIHVTLVPFLDTIKQFKTKPTQHSVKLLQSAGIQPTFVVCRSEWDIDDESRRKISLFSNIKYENVISNPNTDLIYDLPIFFEKQNFGNMIIKHLGLPERKEDYTSWKKIVDKARNATEEIKIGMVGKYTAIIDSYISINEALRHASIFNDRKLSIKWFDSEKIENGMISLEDLNTVDGILLTPGFGKRGVEGMIQAATYVIKHKIPTLGICFGAQMLFIAFSRIKLGFSDANSTEVDPNTQHPVVDLLPEQKKVVEKGGTMRLASRDVYIKRGTKLFDAYNQEVIVERFRHRYHIIKEYAKMGEKHGLVISATDKSGLIVNAIELNDAWIVGVQFHPEYKSRFIRPSPIYNAFIKAILEQKKKE
ncbi:MAG: CTP synthase [Candidatus Odinarchaeota archaeon]|nr:CTP synthase [Candidatus Odinarchaeota archaeon]